MEKNGKNKKPSSVKYALISALCTAGVFVIVAVVLSMTVLKGYFFPKNDSSEPKVTASMPSIVSIGEADPGADKLNVTLYPVPNLKGKYFSEIEQIEDCEPFKIEIGGKQFNDNVPMGTICAQSVEAGKEKERNTLITVTISLGPKTIKMPNVNGLSVEEAKIELLKHGFLYDNIEVIEKYDANSKSEVIIDQTPARGEAVNTDIAVKIYYNSYKEDTEDTNSDVLSDGSAVE